MGDHDTQPGTSAIDPSAPLGVVSQKLIELCSCILLPLSVGRRCGLIEQASEKVGDLLSRSLRRKVDVDEHDTCGAQHQRAVRVLADDGDQLSQLICEPLLDLLAECPFSVGIAVELCPA